MWILIPALGMAQSITVGSALHELYDLDRLMTAPDYRVAQASSYDRAAKSPSENWFANGDYGKYLRQETTGGRTENVMADLTGPGMVTRFWSANPTGTLRFYFDGEADARFVVPMSDLLQGKVAPFRAPFAYNAARGCNFIFPMPYAKGLKVTVETPDAARIYYQIDYRMYKPGTAVETFDPNQLPDLTEAARGLEGTPKMGARTAEWSPNVLARRKESYTMRGPAVIRELRMKVDGIDPKKTDWTNPRAIQNKLRSLVLRVKCDGEQTVYTPLGDFFATSAGLNTHEAIPMAVTRDGEMICRFPIPFASRCEISLQNTGSADCDVQMRASYDKLDKAPALRFHALWNYERGSTRPMRDLPMMREVGVGRFVGLFMHIENPVPGWWGEGDEKVYLNGEAFPSIFGTGTEDYLGYAWSNPELFQRRYHGQSRCDGPGTFGHTNVYRFHVLDDFAFDAGIRFDMEMWHWAEVDGTWATTAYWYAAPGSLPQVETKIRLPRELKPGEPVKGAIEGESLKVVEVTGGTHEVQGGFFEISGTQQRWWLDPKPGDKMVLKLPVPEAGTYEISANMCHARDYGMHEISINGVSLVKHDFYSNGLGWKLIKLGEVKLAQGDALLQITCQGNNEKAEPRRMFGLDYVKLVKKR